jgi:hypothetical protein
MWQYFRYVTTVSVTPATSMIGCPCPRSSGSSVFTPARSICAALCGMHHALLGCSAHWEAHPRMVCTQVWAVKLNNQHVLLYPHDKGMK